MRYSKGDNVLAKRDLSGMNVPDVPAGTAGTVISVSILGRPRRVHFDLMTSWGRKSFDVEVHRGDIE